MRQSRIVAAFIALFMSVSLSLAGVNAANASSSTQSADHSSVVAKAKKRNVTIKFKPFGAKSFQFTGKVSPKGANKQVVLLRSATPKGKYKTFRKAKTDRKGNYKFAGLKTEGYFAVKVGASNGYRTSASKILHICKGC
jgi:uncharacterized surface anchored protein